MKPKAQQPARPEPETRRLREEIDRLQEELAHVRSEFSHTANSRANLLTSAHMCTVTLSPEFKVTSLRNTAHVLGSAALGAPAEDLIPSADGRAYFKGIRYLAEHLPALAEASASNEWTLAYPREAEAGTGLRDWISLPTGAWQTTADSAQLHRTDLGESYLVSPRVIVGPEDDFRIEYWARSDQDIPKDLSVVLGSAAPMSAPDIGTFRPDRNGYCFAFGAMSNYLSELQRCGEAIVEKRDLRVVPGREYHCVAERLGGVLRFWIDDAIGYAALDCLPLLAECPGHVALYTCATRQVFRNVRVWTRPTCLPPETRRLMDALKNTILRVPGEPPRFVEVHYLRNFTFLFKDVTDVVQKQIDLESQQREADKMEALLQLANAAAHEMNQPLTLLVGYLDRILQRAVSQALVPIDQEELGALKEATDRMSAIVEKITAIRRYRTKPYVGQSRILDIEASSRLTQIVQKPPE